MTPGNSITFLHFATVTDLLTLFGSGNTSAQVYLSFPSLQSVFFTFASFSALTKILFC